MCSCCGKTNEAIVPSTIYIMRHGRTDMNDKKLIVGSIDDPINETGRSQAAAATSYFNEGINRIVSSPLSRAKETAKIVGSALNVGVEVDSRLRERCVGGYYEGKPEFPGMLEKFLEEEMPTPGAEPLSAFRERVFDALRSATDQPTKILLVTHALPLLVMLGKIKGWSLAEILDYDVPPNCVPLKFYFGTHCAECGGKFYEPKSD